MSMIRTGGGLAIIACYGLFSVVTFVALLIARFSGRHGYPQVAGQLLSPLGSLYTLTTAFLLSNVIVLVSTLRTSITQEVVTLNKLGAVVSVLPDEQRIEARRLIYDYAESIADDESVSMVNGQGSERTQTRLNQLRDFFASTNATAPKTDRDTPESSGYLRKASDFLFDLIDSREKRLSLAVLNLPTSLWAAILIMFFALAQWTFLVHPDRRGQRWAGMILILSGPIPAILLYAYSHPFAVGLIQIRPTLDNVLQRNL